MQRAAKSAARVSYGYVWTSNAQLTNFWRVLLECIAGEAGRLQLPSRLPHPSCRRRCGHRTTHPTDPSLELALNEAALQVFGMGSISTGTDFFAMGGNSLLAGKVVGRLRSTFRVELPFNIVFEQRTIAGQAGHIQRLQSHGSAEPRSSLPSAQGIFAK